jgi:hypothetical protein
MARDAHPELLAERLFNQLLSGPPATTVLDVVRRILAVQAQDPRGARLAIRSRSTGLHASDVDRALNDKTLLISTLNRGTLHLVTPEDYWLLHPLTTPQLEVANWRRLEQEQVTPDAAERGVAALTKALSRDGALSRNGLRERIASAGVRTEGQAFIHIVFLATLRGLIVRGPMVDGEHGFVLVRDWLGRPPKPLDRDHALGEVARRYLAGHGPASDRDLAKWAGITLGAARTGLRQIADSLLDRGGGLVSLTAPQASYELPPPRLLGSFDPSLHGWVSRDAIVDPSSGIVTTNGIFKPFAMVKGEAVATWGFPGGMVVLTAFEPLSAAVRGALDRDANAVSEFLAG